MAEDMTPEQLVAKLNAVAAAAHRGAVMGLQQACLARQATAMRYCTPGQSPFDPMVFPTKKGGTGAPLDTGLLRANIYAYTEDKGDEIQAGVGCGADLRGPDTYPGYPLFVHEGTSKMQARPFIRMAVEDGEDDTRERLAAAIDAAIKGAAL